VLRKSIDKMRLKAQIPKLALLPYFANAMLSRNAKATLWHFYSTERGFHPLLGAIRPTVQLKIK
jgi:hypothetical protein